MRPITSGIGSAPHRLAKLLAKPLSANLGAVSDAHLKNSGELIERLRDINFEDKCLASFDVKSLFTNVPIDGAFEVIKKVVNNMDAGQLPLRKADYLNLVYKCMKFGCFTFNGDEYVQHSGLAMGSPLSPVAACLYMEWLEFNKYQKIMCQDVLWLRYVDDILVIAPQTMDLDDKLQKLNSVDPNIQLTIEKEKEGSIPFLDTELVRMGHSIKFKVYRKPTNREDYVHYFSGHNDRIKRGIVLGFFLRALRVCSPEYLDGEIQHIIASFTELKYPKGLLLNLKRKAIAIRNRPKIATTRKEDIRYISIPNSTAAKTIANRLETTNVKVAFTTGRKVSEIVSQNSKTCLGDKSVVYKIPCKSCHRAYIGETGRGLEKRLKEHQRDFKNNMDHSALVIHAHHTNHLPDWKGAIILAKCKSKGLRKATEAAHIATNETINTRVGFIKWAKSAARLSIRDVRTSKI